MLTACLILFGEDMGGGSSKKRKYAKNKDGSRYHQI